MYVCIQTHTGMYKHTCTPTHTYVCMCVRVCLSKMYLQKVPRLMSRSRKYSVNHSSKHLEVVSEQSQSKEKKKIAIRNS